MHPWAGFVRVAAVRHTIRSLRLRLLSALAGAAVVLAAAAFGPGLAISAAPGADDSPLRVYVSLPRQGANAATSSLIVRGLRAAVRERGGRVEGLPVRLVQLDDAGGRRWLRGKVQRNAQRAIADERAVAYVGELNSEASAVAEPILALAGMAMFAPVSTAPSLTDRLAAGSAKPILFRSIPTDEDQADALALYMKRSGVRRFALVEDGALYGQGLAATVAGSARGLGIRLIAHRRANRNGRGVRALARALARKSPQAVLFAGSLSSGAVALFKALHQQLPRTLLFGGDALAHDSFARWLGTAQRRTRLTAPAARVNPAKARALGLGARPDPVTVFSYEGMRALLAAIERAGVAGLFEAGRDIHQVREAVRASVFDRSLNRGGLIGPWRIEPDGDSSKRVFSAMRLQNGRVLDRGVIVARRRR